MAVDMLAMTLLSVAMLVSTSSAQVPANVAVGKIATQSSTFNGTDNYRTPPLTYRASADLAVDGAPTKSYLDKTCAVTDWLNDGGCTKGLWWHVNLGGLYDISNVTMFQRGEGAINFGPLLVRVGDHVVRPENKTTYNDRPVVSVIFSSPVTASTVNISITRCSILQLCEVEVFAIRYVNNCAINPCRNGGNCTEGVYNYTCNCVPGYTGVNCETDVNECASNPCRNAGNCSDGIYNYTCDCVPGYTDVNCETNKNECESSPCKNGASCQDLLNEFRCDCPAGYTETNCEIDINECASFPCQNAGDCSDGINSYKCTCLSGYTGTTCETDIDECAGSPCRNKGSCSDGINSYKCACLSGYTGTTCETDIDECSSSPCSHNSLCVDGINNYTCYCAPGYTGFSCIKPCSGGTYGPGCSVACSPHCPESPDRGGQHCDRTTGQCLLQTGCKDGFQGLLCDTKQQTCPAVAASTERYAEGVGTGLGVGLGTSLLLALGIFALLRCRRRGNSPDERRSAGDIQLSSRQMGRGTRSQEVTPGREGGFYESLDDASKELGLSGPYAELGETRGDRETASPYSNQSV